MKKIQHMFQTAKETVSANFKSATTIYLLIMIIVYGFQFIFGSENTVLGLIIGPMMLTLMARDMTAHPLRHFLKQSFILCIMASAACLSSLLPLSVALLLHFSVAFFLLYTYSSDYDDNMYFQYILGYLFLIFLAPVSLKQLPLRLSGMIVGALCLMIYQLVKGRNRIVTVTQDTLLILLDEIENQINSLSGGQSPSYDNQKICGALKQFSQATAQRQKNTLALSDASIAAIDAVQTLEKLILRFSALTPVSLTGQTKLLESLQLHFGHIRAFVRQEQEDIPVFQSDIRELSECFIQLREALLTMRLPEKRKTIRKTSLSLFPRLLAALNYSPMRAAYAFRVSCLLAVCIIFIQYFHLSHGKWLLFTIFSVSLPYADDVGPKAKNRFIATLIGGTASLLVFSLIPSATGRMIAMLVCGYFSCYMTSYLSNFSCATFGALGGAVMMSATGFTPVGTIVLLRIAYIAVGIIIAVAFNCFLFPVDRKKATHHLAQRYIRTTQAVSESYRNNQADPQLHYHLILQMHRLEEKLRQNAAALHWEGVHSFLLHHRAGLQG